MADTTGNLVSLPIFTDSVQRDLLIEPLQGGRDLFYYLDKFPDEIYTKSVDSHLYRFMLVLLGNGGVNWVRKNYLEARILLEEIGISTFDLDSFYGNPLGFGRVFEESFLLNDASGLISKDQADLIRSKDSQYRSRAIDFVNAARAGNSPFGMRLAARSGLGHEVEIIENYKYLYDIHSDDPLGLAYQGRTLSTEEFIVIPRREIPLNETQVVTVSYDPAGGLDGTFALLFNGEETNPIDWNSDPDTLRTELEALYQVGVGNVLVSGGPSSPAPTESQYSWAITFINSLGSRDVPEMTISPSLTNGIGDPNPTALMTIITYLGGRESADVPVDISQRDLRYLQEALDKLRPVPTIPTVARGSGLTTRTNWNAVFPTSQYKEVVRYVKGSANVPWPALTNVFWIEKSIEHEAPRIAGDLQHHYKGFHNIIKMRAYTDDGASDSPTNFDLADANPSEHIGNFVSAQVAAFPFLGDSNPDIHYTADRVTADYTEPLIIGTASQIDGRLRSFVNGIYPTEYQSLNGVPPIRYKDEQFWSSLERLDGDEYLEIDLGNVQGVNFLAFEITHKPINISISYDLTDLSPARAWKDVTPVDPYPNVVLPNADINPWRSLELSFLNSKNEMIFTRFLRVKFSRRSSPAIPFLTQADPFNPIPGPAPWSVDVRNLRIGRTVA